MYSLDVQEFINKNNNFTVFIKLNLNYCHNEFLTALDEFCEKRNIKPIPLKIQWSNTGKLARFLGKKPKMNSFIEIRRYNDIFGVLQQLLQGKDYTFNTEEEVRYFTTDSSESIRIYLEENLTDMLKVVNEESLVLKEYVLEEVITPKVYNVFSLAKPGDVIISNQTQNNIIKYKEYVVKDVKQITDTHNKVIQTTLITEEGYRLEDGDYLIKVELLDSFLKTINSHIDYWWNYATENNYIKNSNLVDPGVSGAIESLEKLMLDYYRSIKNT
ncbi:hypothetical protein U0X36_26050 [Bacillus thuringiensis]|uniref:hypothetical protein n=1 Tax=Bacillus thuringiensis TaxID=1428 RepID=UPI000E54D4CB|nr:hypothetical protein [Bacillus thuringiensis]MDZ3956278.1 hypothetical protein [Bacillus thuringiensis]RGP43004.1 hypothetical protein BTW32_30270 [Bacillus thuringiensis]